MDRENPPSSGPPRIERLRVVNFRALRCLELAELTPLTVLLGPNGSGKSTVFDVLAFLSECFSSGLRTAWEKRGRFRELRTRGEEGPIILELDYREEPGASLLTYHLAIDEGSRGPLVAEEWLGGRPGPEGVRLRFLSFRNGVGEVVRGDPAGTEPAKERLDGADLLAVNTLGQLAKHPRVAALRRFITSWYLSYLAIAAARSVPEAGSQERLSANGANLANVIQHLREHDPERLERILAVLRRRVPRLEGVDAELLADGRLLLRLKDEPFERPIPAKFASDGTLKMLSYLTVLYDPEPPALIGIEEPENHLHPRLLPELTEECRGAASRSQLMVTTHSPFFVNELRANELRVLYRDGSGFVQARRTDQMPGVQEFLAAGAKLGHLWIEGHFDVGDPLTAVGGPNR